MVRKLSIFFFAAVLSSCQTTSDFMGVFSTGPYPNNIGGKNLASSILNFRGFQLSRFLFS